MTVESTTRRAQYDTNGTTGPWTVPFYFLANADLEVIHTDAAGVETTLTLTTHYSVTGAGVPAGGTVTTVSAYAAGGTITVLRSVALLQGTDYVETDAFPAAAHETALDRLTMIAQQQAEVLDRALVLPASDEASGALPSAAGRASKLLGFDASGNPAVVAPASQDASALALLLAGSGGAGQVGFLPPGTGAVATTVQERLEWGAVCVFEFMTPAEIAMVQAFSYATDVTTPCQAAINSAFDQYRDVYFPAGGYLVTGLRVPGRVLALPNDNRNRHFRMIGNGFGEAFALTLPERGTIIRSVTDAPVLQDYEDTTPSSNGTTEIVGFKFDGTSTTPVVQLDSFAGQSSFHNNLIHQRGTGNGFQSAYCAGVHIYENYSFNRDWNPLNAPVAGVRVGVGFSFPMTWDIGLLTLYKNTSRGWLTAYELGSATDAIVSPRIEQCECSVTTNGIRLLRTTKAVVESCYIEGGAGGTGIYDEGDYTTISDNMLFAGFSVGIDATSTTSKGTKIDGNAVVMGAVVNSVGIDVVSSSPFGGYNKTVINNSITFTDGTAGVTGVRIAGTDPRINFTGNAFDPQEAWTGAGTNKIVDNSSGGVFGITTFGNGAREMTVLSRGAVSLQQSDTALTQAHVSANVLTVPAYGSYMLCSATGACTVLGLSAGVTTGRFIVFRTTTANMTFADSATMVLDGGTSFTGPGTITFLVDYAGGTNFAYEVARRTF